MVNYVSNSSGAWGTTTIWTPNGLPQLGDIVTIMPGHNINLGVARVCRTLVIGGKLELDATLYLEDNINAGIIIGQTGAIETIGGTPVTPRLIRSYSAAPTNHWNFQIYNTAGTDTRPFYLEYLECRDNYWSLGNQNTFMPFNYSWLGNLEWLDVAPLTYDPRIEENQCEGRDRSRVYYMGAGAGALQLSGRMLWSNFRWQHLANMARDGDPVALITNYVHMSRGYLEAPRFRPIPGSNYVDFTVTLVEDK